MFISCTYAGSSFGTVIAFPMCGYILGKLDWEVISQLTDNPSNRHVDMLAPNLTKKKKTTVDFEF